MFQPSFQLTASCSMCSYFITMSEGSRALLHVVRRWMPSRALRVSPRQTPPCNRTDRETLYRLYYVPNVKSNTKPLTGICTYDMRSRHRKPYPENQATKSPQDHRIVKSPPPNVSPAHRRGAVVQRSSEDFTARPEHQHIAP